MIHTKCAYCANSGFILDDGVPGTAYACRCSMGDRIPQYVTRWAGPMKRIIPNNSEITWQESKVKEVTIP